MKTMFALCAALLAAAPSSARADGSFEASAPPLPSVLERARKEQKPVLLDFAAVWCGPCKALDKELGKPDNAHKLESFVYQQYDGERGEGVALAERFHVTFYPTLVVLDASGSVLMQGAPPRPEEVGSWLDDAAKAAVATDKELAALVKKRPRDLQLLWKLAERARASKNVTAERSWLAKIESADRTPKKEDAAQAAWRKAELAVSDRLKSDARKLALAHLKKYPGQPMEALEVLAAAGADKKTLEAEYKRVIAATSDTGTLNSLVYTALGAGAYDAALMAAEKQVKLEPDEANPYDSLSEVHHYRGDKDKAIATEKIGLGKKATPGLLAGMRDNLKRFENGGTSSDVRLPGSLDQIFDRKMLTASSSARDPAAITKHMFDSEKGSVTKACSPKAGGLQSALVRIAIGGDSKISKVEVLEPGASSALSRCVADAVRAIRIPADSQAVRVLVEVPFDPSAKTPAKPAKRSK
jgi:thiol-disulfide isomerase/thioredoxin